MMDQKQKEKNIETVKNVLKQYLQDKGYRNTPERYAIIEEIYNLDLHFNVDDLYLLMIQKKYQVSKATIYNTIEIFLDAGLIRKHQFGEKTLTSSSYEKSYFDKQHDHLVVYKPGPDKEIDEIIEFCDPRIQGIKEAIENAFGVSIDSHSLYFYGYKKEN
ncbi:transcriptional repressor [Elizabethkingia meningoseptica]|uniref:Ferric uptake regulation protein n=1 Tax=Elizabethkingia meningoseptica TaxID=238 RepID=A0A1V3U4H7_ELIME|nr:transcriptional repressor [Elizabethkingia meningoseptica]AQX03927.1 transcriptional repressor [Elizabethkingia meningoseptica]AQX11390.1 transcriptional repressor [Elizabethkingia meningoseptica]AQX45967.1 Fur family transcriptional regulator [Elizabethkingia meningoseptica]EJK5329270.1 transcriptional repressor [Elizabethkingia meningoseptica]EOR29784.1 Ferric uptake regulation protein FUR [Elizabethkingia meningoseptica ATCC 13253 = NBRC 12535]